MENLPFMVNTPGEKATPGTSPFKSLMMKGLQGLGMGIGQGIMPDWMLKSFNAGQGGMGDIYRNDYITDHYKANAKRGPFNLLQAEQQRLLASPDLQELKSGHKTRRY